MRKNPYLAHHIYYLTGDLTQNVSLFPGSGRPSLVINASACSIDNSPKCPSKVTNALLSEPSPGVFDKGGAAVGYDPEFAYLMNLTGSGLTTLRTFGFHVESDYTGSRPVPDTMTHVSSSYVVNYPGGPQHSWTLDVGVVSLATMPLWSECADSIAFALLSWRHVLYRFCEWVKILWVSDAEQHL